MAGLACWPQSLCCGGGRLESVQDPSQLAHRLSLGTVDSGATHCLRPLIFGGLHTVQANFSWRDPLVLWWCFSGSSPCPAYAERRWSPSIHHQLDAQNHVCLEKIFGSGWASWGLLWTLRKLLTFKNSVLSYKMEKAFMNINVIIII